MICTVNYVSKSLDKAIGMNVLVPAGKGPFPVLYLLHGLSDDHTGWMRLSMVECKAADLPLIIVMPDGGRSFYCNDPRPGGLAYEDHIWQATVQTVDNTFDTIADRRSRAIAGLSMGGYGAMMLATRHPDVFSVACSHSGALGFAARRFPGRPALDAYVRALPKDKYNLYRLATAMAKAKQKIAIRMDCGETDFLIEDNRLFHKHLEKLGIAHQYEEFPGEHTWEYWNAHIRQTLDFVMAHVKT